MSDLSVSQIMSGKNALRILAPPGAAVAAQGVVANPVAQAGRGGDGAGMMLSLVMGKKVFGADSFLLQMAAGSADHVKVRVATIPADKTAFRAEALHR